MSSFRGTSMTDEWRGLFERSRLVPASSQTVRLAADRHLSHSCGVQLTLSRVSAPHLPKEDHDTETSVNYQVRATLFDRTQQCFFGKTWHSSQQRMRNNKISFNEVLYFHTSLRMPSTVVVLELVALSLKPDSSQQALGQGFTVLELFSSKAEAPAAEENRRLVLHHGSPRSLLHPLLKDIAEDSILLKTVDGAHLDCGVKGHPALLSVMHLLPENVLVSGGEGIPGVVESPSGDSLSRPQLLKMTAFSLSRLTISLQPSLEKFESQLLQLVNTDCQNTKQQGQDCSQKSVVIQERRLHVGVHNGWCFIEKPQVVVLEPTFSGLRGRSDSTSKQSTQTKDSLPALSLPQTLSLRSSLELQLTNHNALAVVFQLEYVFSAPIGRETMLSSTSTSRAAFLQCLRWGVWCPFSGSPNLRGEIRLDLVGGANINPYGVMAYSTDVSSRTESISTPDTSQVSDAKDVIRFQLSSSLERTPSSPKVSLRRKQENGSHRSRTSLFPSHGCSSSPALLLDSPQGPGLSMSQLAATSRYPTISHSSSALPWQQSFPSLLHPSLLASAHQLSHVACSAVSNISHLETDLQPHRDVSSSQDEGEQLRELPFTPVHAPVITLGTSASSSYSASSRSSLAHLFSAGFPDLLDCSGQVAEVLDPTEPVAFDIHREEKDLLQDNLMVFQFLAFSRFQGEGAEPGWPNNIYFTFQFYRFPPVTSQQMKLLSSDKVQVKPSSTLPCVLASVNTDGSVSSGSPGLQVQFKVDDVFLRPGEKQWFLRYLALHTMHIDIWDSDSLLLIGSTAIELKYMLRQGKKAVQALHEVDVLTTNYVGEDTLLTSPEVGHSNPPNPMVVHTVLRGRLHIHTGNIGCHVIPGNQHAGELTPAYSHIITPRKVIGGFRGGCLSTPHIIQLNAKNAAHAQRLKLDTQRVSSLSRADSKLADKRDVNGLDSGRHKLERMAAVYQREGKGDFKMSEVTDQNADVRLARELHLAHAHENKAEVIGNMLSQAITTPHLLFASLGSAEYMEFVLRNPYNVPQTVTIHSDDPELSVLTDAEEWRYFKTLAKTPTVLEEDMFNLEDVSNGPKVYLRPKESLHIPLKYQSFLCDQASGLQGPSFLPKGKSSMAKKTLSNIIRAKTVKVSFKAEDGKPLAICQVNVQPTPHVVDQTFRLYHPELCFVKKAIRLPPWNNPNEDVRSDLSVCCSDPNVICQTRTLVPGEPQDVFLKVPGSPSPHVKMFFVMVFTDKWKAAPSQIWQVYVHFLERVDISCVTGQQICSSLVLRGKQALRKVKCFSSHPLELKVDPASVFMLPPAAVQEIQLKLLPWRTGSRFLFVNAVDVEQRRLVSGWLLCLNVHRPVLSKAFEVHVPVRRGRGSSRKISYTNPYPSSRTFLLRSDHPDLLQFKEDKFKVGAGEVYTIGLRFAPSQSPGSAEILVYVNNQEEKTEETFCVKVVYS
ncbi:nephrocystin-4 isoform X2 [Synchiropus splendidus]|uniref:nephrocystin-4 isoform X2 n=1 Tax=Synchiropus splendidus TaxID=270530 RepID=UPI00237DA941|nr:nephrocystin-4 isoform X2 [Synchiropus splendidus]